jgi:hypothetical protein
LAKKATKANIERDTQNRPMTPEERWELHYPQIEDAKRELEKAQATAKKAGGVYRNALKSFKKAGGNIEMLIAVMRDNDREIDEVERDLKDYNAYCILIGLPVGTQLGLFDKDTTVATKVDEARIAEQHPQNGKGNGDAETFQEGRPLSTEASIGQARTAGFDDGTEGKTARNVYTDGSPEALAYGAAYAEAQEKIAMSLTPKPKKSKKADAPTAH